MFAQPRVSIGIGVGGYGPGAYPPPAYAYQTPCPRPGYTWVDGYYANGGWVAGYWAPPAVVREPVIVRDNVRLYNRNQDNRVQGFRGRDVHFDRDHGRR